MANRVDEQVARDREQPDRGGPALGVELLAALECACEGLGDEVENEVGLRPEAAAQVAPYEIEAALVEQAEALRSAFTEQLLVACLGNHLALNTERRADL